MMATWFKDGVEVQSLDIGDRGFQYADGLFETIAIRDSSARLFDLHLERLDTGARRLGINLNIDQVREDANNVIATHADERALLKLIVTRGRSERGYAPAKEGSPTILAGLFPAARYPDTHYENGVRVRICDTRLSQQPLTAGIKTLGRLDQVMARAEWDDPEIAEGLMLDQQGNVTCGTMTNVFVHDGEGWITPAISECGVSGVMRRQVAMLLDAHQLRLETGRISVDMLMGAAEMFVCNSQAGIWPVAQCGQLTFKKGPATTHVMQLLAASGVREGPA